MSEPDEATPDASEVITDELMTIDAAHAIYDMAERELWEACRANPGFLSARSYVEGERQARRERDRAIQHIRYQRKSVAA